MERIGHAIDWLSVKLQVGTAVILAITWNDFTLWLGGISFATTVVYNIVRIYKELKNKHNDRIFKKDQQE